MELDEDWTLAAEWSGLAGLWAKFGFAVIGLLLVAAGCDEAAAKASKRILARLDEADRAAVLTVEKAKAAFAGKLDAYWREAADKRAKRRAKAKRGIAADNDDFVLDHPPQFAGPQLSEDLAKRLEKLVAEEKAAEGGDKPRKPSIPGVADFLAAAKRIYGFEPERVSEAEFKRRYAREALSLGLTRDQVVRVYALETGGLGTADMQSGINPTTGKGRPISTAIGYAQLLGANTVGGLRTWGPEFIGRLEALAEADPGRAEILRWKADVLRLMLRDARRAGSQWAQHVEYAKTARGLAMHTVNLDGDIGPWLQVKKLHDLTVTAADRGLARLSGGELELMNLAGPGSGLEMLSAIGQDKPTSNFFERGGYERNPVVQRLTGAGLLQKLDERIDVHIAKAGAVEFAGIFDELLGVAAEPEAAPAPTKVVRER